MKVMICGSMTFANEMLATKNRLEELGHQVKIPSDTQQIVDGLHDHDDLEGDYRHCIKNNIMKKHFKFVEENDSILVLNHAKNGLNGYIGAASLMEIGLAYHLGKKIFLLNEIPDPKEARWAHEVKIMQPMILKGDLEMVK